GVAFAAPVVVVLVKVPDQAVGRVIDGANVRAVWTRVAGVVSGGVLDVEVLEHAQAKAGGAVPEQAGAGRAGERACEQRGGNDQNNAPQGKIFLLHFHFFSFMAHKLTKRYQRLGPQTTIDSPDRNLAPGALYFCLRDLSAISLKKERNSRMSLSVTAVYKRYR